jgi:large subunit ribosomal protein L23
MDVLKKPIISHKFASMSGSKVYGFIVDLNANKPVIKNAIQSVYNVQIASIKTIVSNRDKKFTRTRKAIFIGKKRAYKKAIVTLKEGFFINFYDDI